MSPSGAPQNDRGPGTYNPSKHVVAAQAEPDAEVGLFSQENNIIWDESETHEAPMAGTQTGSRPVVAPFTNPQKQRLLLEGQAAGRLRQSTVEIEQRGSDELVDEVLATLQIPGAGLSRNHILSGSLAFAGTPSDPRSFRTPAPRRPMGILRGPHGMAKRTPCSVTIVPADGRPAGMTATTTEKKRASRRKQVSDLLDDLCSIISMDGAGRETAHAPQDGGMGGVMQPMHEGTRQKAAPATQGVGSPADVDGDCDPGPNLLKRQRADEKLAEPNEMEFQMNLPAPPPLPNPPKSPYDGAHVQSSQPCSPERAAKKAMTAARSPGPQTAAVFAVTWDDSDDEIVPDTDAIKEAAARSKRVGESSHHEAHKARQPRQADYAGDRAVVHFKIIAVWNTPEGMQLQLHNPYSVRCGLILFDIVFTIPIFPAAKVREVVYGKTI